MATKYELPEEVNEDCLRTLGKEVEMKTFKTNAALEEEPNDSGGKTCKTNVAPAETSEGDFMVKFIGLGAVIGSHSKGMFIKDCC